MNDVNDDIAELQLSEYNDAKFKMKRLHDLQERINFCWGNPTAFNSEFQVYNYQLIYSSIVSLYREVEAKISKIERKKVEKVITLVRHILRIKNPHATMSKAMGSQGSYVVLDQENWFLMEEGLTLLDSSVRGLLDTHGFGSPEKDEGDLF